MKVALLSIVPPENLVLSIELKTDIAIHFTLAPDSKCKAYEEHAYGKQNYATLVDGHPTCCRHQAPSFQVPSASLLSLPFS